jgi:hypothetical protein
VLSLKRDLYTIIVFIKYLLSDSPTRDANNLHVGENTNKGCFVDGNTNMGSMIYLLVKTPTRALCFSCW